MDMNAAIALTRFGMGHRLGETPPRDAKAWLRAQLAAPDPTPVQSFATTQACLALVDARREAKAAAKENAAERAELPPSPVRERFRAEVDALLGNCLVTQAPFRERLVWFWANHFTISARGIIPMACAGAYVREAIRPYVTARFSDMLRAVMHHPAMLAYLNQTNSTGPDSEVGQRKRRGLNENLARECLELHTVSPASAYGQQDVTNFAKILTGWSIELKDAPRGFIFRSRLHEPGRIEVLGRAWPEGQAGGEALLNFLATHPATYRHIAEKLVRHFVADDPPPRDVQHIAAVLAETQGDLGAASAALIDLPGAWVPGTKLRTPQEYVVACLRAVGSTPEQSLTVAGTVKGLGQGLFQAPFPIGWPDRAADWASSEAMLQRVDFAYGLATKTATFDPLELGSATLGPLLTSDIVSNIKGAGSRRDGMTMLLASPAFLRR